MFRRNSNFGLSIPTFFYPELYKQLLKAEEIKVKDDEKISFTWLFKFGRSIEEILSDIQQSDLTQYPPSYKMNSSAYFLYEESLNRTKEELDSLLETDSEELSRELREGIIRLIFINIFQVNINHFLKIRKLNYYVLPYKNL